MNTTVKTALLGLNMAQLKDVAKEMGMPAFAAKQMPASYLAYKRAATFPI